MAFHQGHDIAALGLLEIVLDGGVASAAVPLGDAIYFGTGNTYDGTGASIQAWRLVSSP